MIRRIVYFKEIPVGAIFKFLGPDANPIGPDLPLRVKVTGTQHALGDGPLETADPEARVSRVYLPLAESLSDAAIRQLQGADGCIKVVVMLRLHELTDYPREELKKRIAAMILGDRPADLHEIGRRVVGHYELAEDQDGYVLLEIHARIVPRDGEESADRPEEVVV